MQRTTYARRGLTTYVRRPRHYCQYTETTSAAPDLLGRHRLRIKKMRRRCSSECEKGIPVRPPRSNSLNGDAPVLYMGGITEAGGDKIAGTQALIAAARAFAGAPGRNPATAVKRHANPKRRRMTSHCWWWASTLMKHTDSLNAGSSTFGMETPQRGHGAGSLGPSRRTGSRRKRAPMQNWRSAGLSAMLCAMPVRRCRGRSRSPRQKRGTPRHGRRQRIQTHQPTATRSLCRKRSRALSDLCLIITDEFTASERPDGGSHARAVPSGTSSKRGFTAPF